MVQGVVKSREICNTYICIYSTSNSSSITWFQNSKIPTILQRLPWRWCCLKIGHCKLHDVGMLHFAKKTFDQKTLVRVGLPEKYWNFGISTGYPHFLSCKLLIHKAFSKLSTIPIWFCVLEFCSKMGVLIPKCWNLARFARTTLTWWSTPIPKFQNLVPRFQFIWAYLEFWNFTDPWTTK